VPPLENQLNILSTGDEEKPECSQCRKGGRECRPSEGVVFRHQQNASMNRNLNQSPEGRGSLNGFYSYKNTFDKDSVWLDVPKDGKATRRWVVGIRISDD
jgi:hypothetical protein